MAKIFRIRISHSRPVSRSFHLYLSINTSKVKVSLNELFNKYQEKHGQVLSHHTRSAEYRYDMHNNSGTLYWRSGVTLLRNISKPSVEVHEDPSVPRDGPRAYLRRLHVTVLCLMVCSADSASDQGSHPQASETHQLLSLRDLLISGALTFGLSQFNTFGV